MRRKIKLAFICGLLLLLLSACGDKSELKSELDSVRLANTLPQVRVTNCRKLSEADDAVYEQQIAACEMYYEAYDLTRTSDYIDEYKGDLKKNKIAYYCNLRRQELQLDIDTELSDNIRSIMGKVEDCDNINAYIKRVNYDVVNFYDYYNDYKTSKNDETAACKILRAFYQRSNILAFRFMNENKDDFILKAVKRIEENSHQTENLNSYIAENNDIIKALNAVYGGIPSNYVEIVTKANVELARRLLETDNDLSEADINSLMYQLGEPTPSPEPTETPEPTPEPEPDPTEEQTPEPAPEPERPESPERNSIETPTPTEARVLPQRTPTPIRTPAPTPIPAPAATPEVYIFGE